MRKLLKAFIIKHFRGGFFGRNAADNHKNNLNTEEHPIYHLFARNFNDEMGDEQILEQLIIKFRQNQINILQKLKNGDLTINKFILKT